MSYITKNLMPGEEVVREARLSRIVYLPALLVLILSLSIFSVLFINGSGASTNLLLPALLLAASLILALRAAYRRGAIEFALTNKRVIVKTGVMRRHSAETLLRQVEGITVDQGIFGRIFNYGTIVIEGTGTDRTPYSGIAAPMQFRLSVMEQIDRAAAPATPAAPMPHDAEQSKDPYFVLLRMNALKERGIMTDEEFQREKRKILGHA